MYIIEPSTNTIHAKHISKYHSKQEYQRDKREDPRTLRSSLLLFPFYFHILTTANREEWGAFF